MGDLIYSLANAVNSIHDLITKASSFAGFSFTDKDLHLWVFGIMGVSIFAIVHALFKKLIKYSLTAISFIYTFTLMVVISFAVEIQQKITGRGHMEFADAVISIWGFILFFLGVLLLRLIIFIVNNYIFNTKSKK